jgi:hypothetical protein
MVWQAWGTAWDSSRIWPMDQPPVSNSLPAPDSMNVIPASGSAPRPALAISRMVRQVRASPCLLNIYQAPSTI